MAGAHHVQTRRQARPGLLTVPGPETRAEIRAEIHPEPAPNRPRRPTPAHKRRPTGPANRRPTATADADGRANLRPARVDAAGQYLQDTRRQSSFFEYTRE
jgi:hypothetical protein